MPVAEAGKHPCFELVRGASVKDVVWGKIPCPPDYRGVRGYLGRGHLVVAYRSGDDQLQLACVILKGTFGEIRGSGVEHWITEIADFVTPALAAHLRTPASAVEKPFLLDSASDCVES